MPLFVERGAEVENRGERVLFAKDPDTGKDVYLWLRPMPHYVQQIHNLQVLRSGDKSKLESLANPESFTDPAVIEEVLDRLAWSITDSENFPVHIEDDEAAKFYTRELGSKALKKGEPLILDGLWTRAIRERLVRKFDVLADFILDQTDEIRERKAETKQERTKNLAPGSSGKSRPASRALAKKGARRAKS